MEFMPTRPYYATNAGSTARASTNEQRDHTPPRRSPVRRVRNVDPNGFAPVRPYHETAEDRSKREARNRSPALALSTRDRQRVEAAVCRLRKVSTTVRSDLTNLKQRLAAVGMDVEPGPETMPVSRYFD